MNSYRQTRPNTSDSSFITVYSKIPTNNPLSKLKLTQIAKKSQLQKISILQTGKPGQHPLTPQQISFESRMNNMLQNLQQKSDYRPSLINFNPVNQYQLIRHILPSNTYSRSSIVQHQELLYRVYKTDSRLVRSILQKAGFQYTQSHDWNIMWLGSSAKPYLYQGLNEHQRINHFPNTFQITRKDRLCMSIVKMQEKFGKDAFNFIPTTFVLPDQYEKFWQKFNRKKQVWILKPACSSRGRGIFLIESLLEVPQDQQCIISKYISNPLLIKNLKFDLRIYVLISSFEPLKIYIYNQGLARFASQQYTKGSKNNKFVHLTNYSVNKKNDRFVHNTNWKKDDVGHKWSIKALLRHLQTLGIDTDLLWTKIYDMIIKTVLSIQHIVVQQVRRFALHRNNCFDLFGFDIMIDQNLKPWLLEVNLSPSLATDAPIDLHIKSNLIADTFNLIGLRYFNRKKQSMNKVRTRIRARKNQMGNTRVKNILDQSDIKPQFFFSAKFKAILKDSLEQFKRRNNFIRIYPAQNSSVYDQYFSKQRVYNRALYQALFQSALQKEPEIKRPFTSRKSVLRTSSKTNTKMGNSSKEKKFLYTKKNIQGCKFGSSGSCKQGQDQKIVITGDDILIEYIQRVVQMMKSFNESAIKKQWKLKLERFNTHYLWKQDDDSQVDCVKRLENRLIEMKGRKKMPLIGKAWKSQSEQKKQVVLKGFSADQLEEMLRTSNKSVVQEVVGCLVDQEGLLSTIIKNLGNYNIHR